jgi:hypothetical protein
VKTPTQVSADIRRRLGNSWHRAAAGIDDAWPHRFPLGAAGRAELEGDFGAFQQATFTWREWADAHAVTLIDTTRRVSGTTQLIPTHTDVASIDVAAAICGPEWVERLRRGRERAAVIADRYPKLPDVAAVVRQVDSFSPVDFALLCEAADWFSSNSAVGLTPRQVPVPGLHAKWLNTRQSLVAILAGIDDLGLLPPHPGRIHFTYLDPAHRAAGGRRQDSATVGDRMSPAYQPRVLVISENKDTAIHFPELPGGISMEGEGKGARAPAAFDWVRDCPLLVYWGDMDADGFEILDGYRAAGLPLVSILMDLATYEAYEAFGTWTDPKGVTLTAAPRRPLPHLTDAERELYSRLTEPDWPRVRRVEQEKIPLDVARTALDAVLPTSAMTDGRS